MEKVNTKPSSTLQKVLTSLVDIDSRLQLSESLSVVQCGKDRLNPSSALSRTPASSSLVDRDSMPELWGWVTLQWQRY